MSESTIVTMQDKDLKKVTSVQRVMKIIAQILLYLFLGVMALIVVFPFYWMKEECFLLAATRLLLPMSARWGIRV